jgi:hypothetical protein
VESRRWIAVLTAVALLAAGCSSAQIASNGGGTSIGDGVHLAAARLPPGVEASVTTSPMPSVSGGLKSLSRTYRLTPSGPLPAAATITIPLQATVSGNEAVIVATRESTADPWTYLPATLGADHASVTFHTSHFSTFTVMGFDLNQLTSVFKSDFLDQIDGGVTTTVTAPTCTGQAEASANGYSTALRSHTDTLQWCLGMAGSSAELEVVNNRHYPLEVLHPHMTVTDAGAIDYGQLASLSHFASGAYTVIAPGEQATFGASLTPGGAGGVVTQMDGWGQSLYALQTGVNTMFEILDRFGLGGGSDEVDAANRMLGATGCLGAIGHGSVALLAACFGDSALEAAFGAKAAFLIPLMAAGPVIAFFNSEYEAFVDQYRHNDTETIEVARAAIPTWSFSNIDANNGLLTVSCPSTSFCAAGDSNGNIALFNGTTWGQPQRVDTSGGYMNSVSCATSSATVFCAAVDASGNVVTYEGGSWGDPEPIDPGGSGLLRVSCASISFCVAVDADGSEVTYDGSGWSTPHAIDPTGGQLWAVSCPSSSFCGAFDNGGSVVSYNGSTWTPPSNIDSNSGIQGSTISCSVATFCMVSDSLGNMTGLIGGAWSQPEAVDQTRLTSVSCASTNFCLAVDYAGNLLTYTNGSWSQPTPLAANAGILWSVSCASTTFCAVVGDGGIYTYSPAQHQESITRAPSAGSTSSS